MTTSLKSTSSGMISRGSRDTMNSTTRSSTSKYTSTFLSLIYVPSMFRYLELTGEHVVYGFSEEKLVSRKMCEIDMLLQENGDVVSVELKSRALNGDDNCLHRDKVVLTPLEREKDQTIVESNDLWFQNLESLESILSTAIFHEDGVEGYWYVNQDDLYASKAQFKNFFMLKGDEEKED